MRGWGLGGWGALQPGSARAGRGTTNARRHQLQRVCVVGGTLHGVDSMQRSAFSLAYLSLCGQDDGLVIRLVQAADQL